MSNSDTKRILVTGARAPVALELCRAFAAEGHTVFAADSLRFGICRGSRAIEAYFRVPPPAIDPKGFAKKLGELVEKHQIDLVVPSCEEVFFLSRYRDLIPCEVFADDFEKLAGLHNKLKFTEMAADCGALVPDTRMLGDVPEDPTKFVFKPEFSRFGMETIIRPEKFEKPNDGQTWIAQEFADGVEHCSYGVFRSGQLAAYVCYKPVIRLQHSAGVIFEPVVSSEIEGFVRRFGEKHTLHGQVAFDFIVRNDGVPVVIECNPRTTSGAHFFSGQIEFARSFLEDGEGCFFATEKKPLKLAAALRVFRRQAIQQHGRAEIKRYEAIARDVLHSDEDPVSFAQQLLMFSEWAGRAIWRRCSLQKASTFDMEWNGEELSD
ncbi:MAG: hypothetical protein ACI8UO_002952 [Verrucomicrobiales bacterium]